MNDKEFKQLMQKKNELAHELYEELLYKRGNLPNKFNECAIEFYWFYHDALFDSDSEYYFSARYDAPLSEFEKNEARLREFQRDKDYQEFIAVEVFLAIDCDEFGDL